MSESKKIFLTGATGFLGSHLAHRLLQQGHSLGVLARPSKIVPARQRVEQILQQIGAVNLDRLSVYDGDIGQSRLGLTEDSMAAIAKNTDEVWHCAASLSFAEEDRDDIFRMNVGGTRNLLELVEQTSARRLHHVSTAYVAGKRTGVVLESEIDAGQTFKNPYEESKCQAELMIDRAHREKSISATIYRPSIVIGDSRTGKVTHFHGVYAFIRGLWSALERLRRRMPPTRMVTLPLRVLGSEITTLNFVPIDYVVDGMIEISCQSSGAGGTYHLTNPSPTENRVWLPNICRILGVEGVQLVDSTSFATSPVTRLEAVFQKQMAFYYQYLQGEPNFDCRETLAALRNTGIDCPRVTVEFIEKMMGWYVNFLNGNQSEVLT